MTSTRAPGGAATLAPKGRQLTAEQKALRHALQDTWEQLEGKRAHTAGRLLGRFVRQLPPLYMGERNDHKLLKPGETLREGERIVSLETMATGVFKGKKGGKKLPAICGVSTAEEVVAALKAAGLLSCRRVQTHRGLMAAYSVNTPAILAENPTALLTELEGIAAAWKARKASRSGTEVSPENGDGYPRKAGNGIPVFRGTNSHTQATPLSNNSHGAERMEGCLKASGSASPMDGGPPAPLAALASPEGKPAPDCAPPPPTTEFPMARQRKPPKLLHTEHDWLKARERAGYKRVEWSKRDFGAVQQMARWWSPEFGSFDGFLTAVPGMWRHMLPAFAHMTNNPPPKAPCIRFVWANIDAFAHAHREGPTSFVARLKAPLSKEEKSEIARRVQAGADRKAAAREVYKQRWPKAQGLGMLRLRQDQKRTRRNEAEAAQATQRREAEEFRAVQAIGQIARSLAPNPAPAPALKQMDWGLLDAAMNEPVAARAVERFREWLRKGAVPPETDEQMNAALRSQMKSRFDYLSRGLSYEERRLRSDPMTADFPVGPRTPRLTPHVRC